MLDIKKELARYGFDRLSYESCLKDIEDKLSGITDIDWAEIVAKYNLGIHPDTLRKASQTIFGGAFVSAYWKANNEANVLRGTSQDEYLESLKETKLELEKARRKLQDERTDFQRTIREEARRESFLELIKRVFENTVSPEPFNLTRKSVDSDNDMVVILSDLHGGMDVDNWFNKYNTTVLKNRLHQYLVEIDTIQKTHNCKECHLVLGGDLISGLIHRNLRLENNENVVEQVKIVSEYVGFFTKELMKEFEKVKVYSVSGNHSRLSPSKEDHLKGEELDSLVPFYLKLMFEGSENIKIYDNIIDSTILSFKTRGGYLFYGVHGDKDTVKNVVEDLTLMTGVKPDAIIIGHRHHNGYDTVHGVKVIESGSVIGMDEYCVDRRISGRPEQCVVITDNKNAVRCFYDIAL